MITKIACCDCGAEHLIEDLLDTEFIKCECTGGFHEFYILEKTPNTQTRIRTMEEIEIELHNYIKDLFQEIKDMHPVGGLSSPRDIELSKEINKKAAIMDRVQDAMRVINPDFEIRS